MIATLLKRNTLSKILFILTTIYSIIGLQFTRYEAPNMMTFFVFKFVFYCISLTILGILITRIKYANYWQLLFFICSLFVVFHFDFSGGDLYLGERVKWLFYTATILVANKEDFNLWKNTTLILLVVNLIMIFFFPSSFFLKDESWDGEIQRFPQILLMGSLFLFGFQDRLTYYEKFVLYTSVIITIGIYIYFGRRTATLNILLFMIIPLFAKKDNISKIVYRVVGIISILLISAWVYISYFSNNLFSYFFERLAVDTRSEVDYLAVSAINNTNSWLFGLGVQGGYPNPIDYEIERIRTMVETGILDIIMDGGVILAISLIILLIYGVIKGYLSRDKTIRVYSLIVLIYLILQYPIGQPGIDMYGFMIFTAIGICSNDETYTNLRKKFILKQIIKTN